ncbi:hypothetical protein CONLIGDRAFT_640673 [Coniochaeta ligniaria NRRL 30616]|uniref:Uncharacterized protein n=1 Tax=Coniochaeta ligniaria NRRL 30616 TaxID=1408157 RepID=A0A1J7JU52_9PEZI|nr:hypothetical protein CONLIGDRAFT_640673 [Coniochaeta ligniaria NRRL 30616]
MDESCSAGGLNGDRGYSATIVTDVTTNRGHGESKGCQRPPLQAGPSPTVWTSFAPQGVPELDETTQENAVPTCRVSKKPLTSLPRYNLLSDPSTLFQNKQDTIFAFQAFYQTTQREPPDRTPHDDHNWLDPEKTRTFTSERCCKTVGEGDSGKAAVRGDSCGHRPLILSQAAMYMLRQVDPRRGTPERSSAPQLAYQSRQQGSQAAR